MKNSRSEIFKRQNQILQTLNSKNIVIIEETAQELGVSPLTIRRDLDTLAEKGLLERFHGGARPVERVLNSDPATNAKNESREQKKRMIAFAAAQMVKPDDTIFINSSTTALHMLEFLAEMPIIVITNNANALFFADRAKFSLVFTGGEINAFKHSMVGDIPIQMLKSLHANKCFIGVSGINKNGDLSSAGLKETTVNITMMEQTNEKIVILADSSKLGVQHNYDIGSLDNATHIITDKSATEEQLKILRAHSAEVVVASDAIGKI